MNRELYEKIINNLRKSKAGKCVIGFGARYLPLVLGLFYILAIIFVFFKLRTLLLRIIIVPALTFIIISVFRRYVNRPRPYTTLKFEPLLPYKENKGKSFPSRHTVCAFIIAYTLFYISPFLGVIACILALFVGVSRVLSGMHYISDVVVGILASSLAAVIGYIII